MIFVNSPPPHANIKPLGLLSVVIPAKDEEGCIESTVYGLHVRLTAENIAHEIVVVDDGSTDHTWPLLVEMAKKTPQIYPVQNIGQHGFGRAIAFGLERIRGDAVVIMMADASDDAGDVVLYWEALNEGYDCVFGSRFMKGSKIIDYPFIKLIINRIVNKGLQLLFRIRLNDTTNAFKAYRTEVIRGCEPLFAQHFNLTVEIPLKAIIRGYSWKSVPIHWSNRRTGVAKLKLKEMGSRYLFIVLYCWLEKKLSRGDYHRK
jgi:dolichol-phosphate mannosyltransferase